MTGRRTIGVHECGHAVVLAALGATATRLRIYDEPEAAVSLLGNDALLLGITHHRGRLTTLDQARVAIAGYAAERICGVFERDAGTDDECVFARRLSDAAAKAANADPNIFWTLEVKAKVRKILKANRTLIDCMADELLRNGGYVGGKKLRGFLQQVKPIEGGAP
jgi:hypothetical protein